MSSMTVSVKHLTDSVIEKAFAGTDFERDDYRALLTETVVQIAAGYSCGYTVTAIAIKLGLLTPVKEQPTKAGHEFVYDHLYRRKSNDQH
jgi:hypothetical protein